MKTLDEFSSTPLALGTMVGIRSFGVDDDGMLTGSFPDTRGLAYQPGTNEAVCVRLGQLDLAEKYLVDATRLLPRDATVHEHLGDVLAARGNLDRALGSYRTALDLDPESKDVDKIRGKIAELERKAQTSAR